MATYVDADSTVKDGSGCRTGTALTRLAEEAVGSGRQRYPRRDHSGSAPAAGIDAGRAPWWRTVRRRSA
jgi:hypothetical protein